MDDVVHRRVVIAKRRPDRSICSVGAPQDGLAIKVWHHLVERLAALPNCSDKEFMPLLMRFLDLVEQHDLLRVQANSLGLLRLLSRWTPPSLDGAAGYARRQALQQKLQALYRA